MHDVRPSLRPGLAAQPHDDPRFMVVWDQLRISRNTLQVPRALFTCMQRMDGERSLTDLQNLDGTLVPLDALSHLLRHLDEALFLAGPRFDAALAEPVRSPACIGCYSGEPAKLREQLRQTFLMPGGPGLPGEPKPDGRLRAALLPHIDYARGGPSYPFGFKEIVERSDASLFVILATSHYSPNRFTLTRKHFKTPLGLVPTDQAYIDRLVKHYGDGLFDDPFAHYPEHSVELEVVYLQYLYENVRPIRIVPLVVGSFHDCVEGDINPRHMPDVRRMIEALKAVEAETPEPVCYVISGDLAHIGPKFRDPDPMAEPLLTHSREQDHVLIRKAEAVDANGYFEVIRDEQDRRRICGLPPTFVVLEAVQPKAGRLLSYGQYVHPRGFESVSFASMAFDR
ncbi:MAG: AmmeMemoRadiSam system protein B [Gemmataceae bacterium]